MLQTLRTQFELRSWKFTNILNQGEFFNYWLTPKEYEQYVPSHSNNPPQISPPSNLTLKSIHTNIPPSKAAAVITGEKARKLQKQVWEEMLAELEANVPDVLNGLEKV